MLRPRASLAVLAASTVLIGGCSVGPDGSGSTTTVLRVGLSEESGALDPHAFTGNFLLLDAVYEPLVTYAEGGKLEPGLARSWTVAKDGRSVSFDLRDGVTFTDGTPLDSAAVKWNFERWVGKKEFTFFRASQVISAVETPDEDTVRLILSEPYEPLLQELSIIRPVRLLSPKAATADGTFRKAVGTGAWKLESNSATGAKLTRNDDYWGTRPKLERVDFTVIPDSQARLDALGNREIDLIGGAYLAPITPVEARTLSGRGGITSLVGEPDVSIMLGFNADGPAGDRAVREAVRQAIDTTALTKALFQGYGEPARRVFPPNVPDSGTDLPEYFDRGGGPQDTGRRRIHPEGRQPGQGREASRPQTAHSRHSGPRTARPPLDGRGHRRITQGDRHRRRHLPGRRRRLLRRAGGGHVRHHLLRGARRAVRPLGFDRLDVHLRRPRPALGDEGHRRPGRRGSVRGQPRHPRRRLPEALRRGRRRRRPSYRWSTGHGSTPSGTR